MKPFLSLLLSMLATVGSIALLLSSQACERKIQNTYHAHTHHTREEMALPAAVQRFLRAKALHNTDSLMASFAPDALIQDEINRLQDEEAIRQWTYHHIAIGGTVQVLDTIPDEEAHTLLLAWTPADSGDWQAYYTFWHQHGRITGLQIGRTPPAVNVPQEYPTLAQHVP